MRVKPLLACAGLLASALVVFSPSAAQAAPTRYEAETSPAVCTGTVDANWSGYSGSGFCNGSNSTSGYVEFTVNASAAGTGTLGVRFANGTTTARPANLLVNGSTVQSPSFEGTVRRCRPSSGPSTWPSPATRSSSAVGRTRRARISRS